MMGAVVKESEWKKRVVIEKFSKITTPSDEAFLVFVLENYEEQLQHDCRMLVSVTAVLY